MGLRRDKGFTLIEMAMALVVLSIVLLAGFQLLSTSMVAYNHKSDDMHLLDKLGYAVTRISREVREMSSTSGVYDITTMTASRLVFAKTDGVNVTLDQTGTLLTLDYDSVAGGPFELCDEVSAFTLNYYQGDGITAATGASDVAFIEVDMTLSQSGRSFSQRTRTRLRNGP